MKMQNVSFKNVDDFLEYLPDNELKIVEFLRRTVFDCIPMAIEYLSFNVPFYKVNRAICFIWPASILWGKKQTYEGVRFGLTTGYLISDEMNYLDRGDRKQVYWKDFSDLREIDIDLLKSYIFEAALIDEKNKKGKEKNRKIGESRSAQQK
jgi:Domain of unknown function (DU1801)